ncbi:trace amine-associated receptor 13c-like [Mya arenaria]|uniref:trace amine-associated receptor 13c-like n=1 Tax=Mya arenaria TaxID=6604 RepID=UPI0022E4E952|nr:trace amine-associated receptor 13c-like [Mya arenaria]
MNASEIDWDMHKWKYYNISSKTKSIISSENISSEISHGGYLHHSGNLVRAYNLYFLIVSAILILPTVIGNLLILISLVRFSRLRRVKAYILVGNLALADLLVGLIALPMDLLSLSSARFSQSVEFCYWHVCFMFTYVGMSVVNLFVLSLERFHAIVYPFQHGKRFTKHRLYILMACTWLSMGLFGFSPLYTTLPEVEENSFDCRTNEILPSGFTITFNAIMLTALVGSTVFFVIVVRIARHTITRFKTVESSTDHQRIRREIRHTRNMVIISGLFIIFWGPYCIISFIPGGPHNHRLMLAKSWISSLGVINCCINWLVYGVRSATFRAAFLSILSCKCTRKHFNLPFSTT